MPEESDPPLHPTGTGDPLDEVLIFGDPETRRQFLKKLPAPVPH